MPSRASRRCARGSRPRARLVEDASIADLLSLLDDTELFGKAPDVSAMNLAQPEHEIVLCVDEKSPIQALERTGQVLPMLPGLSERRSHDYYRHGTSPLFGALAAHKHTNVRAWLEQNPQFKVHFTRHTPPG